MKITVFGASGKVGKLIVEELLRQGHEVTAFIHRTSMEPSHRLKIIKGDIYGKKDVDAALSDCDAVISALSSWGTPSMDILSAAMQNIIPAMKEKGIKRIVSLTGSGAKVPGEKSSLVDLVAKKLLKPFAGKVFEDGEKHIELLNSSALDWTIIRSPVMTSYGNPGSFKVSLDNPRLWATIHRQSVALSIAELASSNDFCKQAPFITRG
ncbi:SDR family oxidoreductase [soil metagenome]